MSSIKNFPDRLELRIGSEDLIAMPVTIAPGQWNVGNVIARAAIAHADKKVPGLEFSIFKVYPARGEFIIVLYKKGMEPEEAKELLETEEERPSGIYRQEPIREPLSGV